MEKIRKIPLANFSKNPQNEIFSLFKVDDTLPTCKKSKNFKVRFRRKSLDKLTSGQTKGGYFIMGPLLRRSKKRANIQILKPLEKE